VHKLILTLFDVNFYKSTKLGNVLHLTSDFLTTYQEDVSYLPDLSAGDFNFSLENIFQTGELFMQKTG